MSNYLDGTWAFRWRGLEGGGAGPWRQAAVPAPWQAVFEDLRTAAGHATYRRGFEVPGGWLAPRRRVLLRFGAVSETAVVRVNGERVGTHEGGWLPFGFDVTEALRPGANEVEVDVALPNGDPALFPDGPIQEVPHGKQSWYGPLGGLWQSVQLLLRAEAHIAACRVVADLAMGEVRAAVAVASPRGILRAAVTGPDGRIVARAEVPAALRAELALRVPAPASWSPAAPHLYGLELDLVDDEQVADRRREAFGFRTIEAKGGRLLLNGESLYLRGALDQDYFADGICTPPSLAALEDQLLKAKAMGFNCLRCHIKVPDPRYYEVADRLGMLVWSEIPNVARLRGGRAEERLWATMEGILARDGNHPCIVAWTIINEDWGTHLDEDPDDRRWLAQAYTRLKALDPTRLVVDNSACFPNAHVRTDVADYHYYRGIPDRREEWDAITAQFAARAPWVFAPDGQPTGEEPLIVSEFVGWGLPDPTKLRDDQGREPWWFESGQGFADGVAYLHGIEHRFDRLRLARVFGDFAAFIEAAQWQQYRGLKYHIESIRGHAEIAGYVASELTDVHWECNGVMDMRRNTRVFHERLADVNAELVILPRLQRWAWWGGETVEVAPAVATGAAALGGDGARLDWQLAIGGVVAASGSAGVLLGGPCVVVGCAPVRIAIPALEQGAVAELRFALHDVATSARLARAIESVTLIPARPAHAPGRPAVWTDDAALKERFAALGYPLAAEAAEAGVVVSQGSLDSADTEAIRTGRRHLFLADALGGNGWLRSDHPAPGSGGGAQGLPAPVNPPFPGIARVSRESPAWRGDWIGTFSWLARSGAFAALPGGPMLDMAFDRVVPRHDAVGNFPLWEREAGGIHAGIIVGWVHKPAALIVERPFGAGKLLMSTFRLAEDPAGTDPVAATLLDALVATTVA